MKEYYSFSVVTSTDGTSSTAYGFTGETMDANGLVYLRARYYSSSAGRFLSRDTWGGDYNRPLSLNRWMYVEGNPVNLVDPSGHIPAFWCQIMLNKGLYELCIARHYGIEPMNPRNLGEHVGSSWLCYTGPKEYKAPGYIEGTSLTIAAPVFANWLFAYENVYDFATMEQSAFINGSFGIYGMPGIGVSDFVWGIVGAQYAGNAYGFLTTTGVQRDYPGPVIAGYIGVSNAVFPIANDTAGIGGGAGTTFFASPYPPYIRGTSQYVSLSIGVDLAYLVDAGVGALSMMPIGNTDKYVDEKNGDVQKARLFRDILFGGHNGRITHTVPFLSAGPDLKLDWAARSIAAIKALRYAEAYEELQNE